MTLRRLALVGLAALVAAPAAAWGKLGPDGWEIAHRPAHAFALQDLEGRRLRSSELAGKLIVVDFWATWCGPCIKELPDLIEYWKGLQKRTDVVFLSVAVTEEAKTVRSFAAKEKIPYPIYLGDDLLGPYEVAAFPTKLIIDARAGAPGVVRFRREGFTPASLIEKKVAELLAEKSGSATPAAPRRR